MLWKKRRSESCCAERIQCCGRGGVGVDVMRGYSAVEEEEEWKLL